MYQRTGSATALNSAARKLDLSPSWLALLLDRDHWRVLRSELGDGACEVEDVAFTADSKNPARMICNRRFWLIGWVRATGLKKTSNARSVCHMRRHITSELRCEASSQFRVVFAIPKFRKIRSPDCPHN